MSREELEWQKRALEHALECGRSTYQVWCGPSARGETQIDLKVLLDAVNFAIEKGE